MRNSIRDLPFAPWVKCCAAATSGRQLPDALPFFKRPSRGCVSLFLGCYRVCHANFMVKQLPVFLSGGAGVFHAGAEGGQRCFVSFLYEAGPVCTPLVASVFSTAEPRCRALLVFFFRLGPSALGVLISQFPPFCACHDSGVETERWRCCSRWLKTTGNIISDRGESKSFHARPGLLWLTGVRNGSCRCITYYMIYFEINAGALLGVSPRELFLFTCYGCACFAFCVCCVDSKVIMF